MMEPEEINMDLVSATEDGSSMDQGSLPEGGPSQEDVKTLQEKEVEVEGGQVGQDNPPAEAKDQGPPAETSKKGIKSFKKGKLQRKLDKAKTKLDRVASKIKELNDHESEADLVSDVEVMQEPDHRGYQYPYRNLSSENHRDRYQEYIREEKISRICPEDNLDLYIKKIEEMLALDKVLTETTKKAMDVYDSLFNDFRKTPPSRRNHNKERKRCYDIVVDAYRTIKARLARGTENCDEYERLVASLEVVGQIIFTPCLLNNTDMNYSGRSEVSLRTTSFTTKWTSNRVEKITWPDNNRGLCFHYVKRSVVKIG